MKKALLIASLIFFQNVSASEFGSPLVKSLIHRDNTAKKSVTLFVYANDTHWKTTLRVVPTDDFSKTEKSNSKVFAKEKGLRIETSYCKAKNKEHTIIAFLNNAGEVKRAWEIKKDFDLIFIESKPSEIICNNPVN